MSEKNCIEVFTGIKASSAYDVKNLAEEIDYLNTSTRYFLSVCKERLIESIADKLGLIGNLVMEMGGGSFAEKVVEDFLQDDPGRRFYSSDEVGLCSHAFRQLLNDRQHLCKILLFYYYTKRKLF